MTKSSVNIEKTGNALIERYRHDYDYDPDSVSNLRPKEDARIDLFVEHRLPNNKPMPNEEEWSEYGKDLDMISRSMNYNDCPNQIYRDDEPCYKTGIDQYD